MPHPAYTHWLMRLTPAVAALLLLACSDAGACRPRSGQTPVHSVEFHVARLAQHEFLGELEKTAKKYGMEYRAAQVRPDGLHWSAEGMNQDLRVIAVNALEVETFDVHFYDCAGKEIPHEVMSAFLADLTSGIQTLAGVSLLRTKDDRPAQP